MLSRRHGETWARSDGLRYLSIGISDAPGNSRTNK
jgi:hypothetical protein